MKGLVFLANCQLPIASCLFSKIPYRIAAPRWEESTRLYHLFASASTKKRAQWVVFRSASLATYFR